MNNYSKHVFRAARRLSHNVRLLYYNMQQDNNNNSMYAVYAQGDIQIIFHTCRISIFVFELTWTMQIRVRIYFNGFHDYVQMFFFTLFIFQRNMLFY